VTLYKALGGGWSQHTSHVDEVSAASSLERSMAATADGYHTPSER